MSLFCAGTVDRILVLSQIHDQELNMSLYFFPILQVIG